MHLLQMPLDTTACFKPYKGDVQIAYRFNTCVIDGRFKPYKGDVQIVCRDII